MPSYRLAVASLGTSGLGTAVISDVFTTVGVPAGQAPLRYSNVLNAPGSLEFVLPIDHASVTTSNFGVGTREVHLYRTADAPGSSEVMVWGGFLTSADVSGWAVRFSALGWYSRLRRRVVVSDLAYTATDQLNIAWNLINHAQSQTNGGFGITRASNATSGVTRTAVYCIENQVVVANAIEELAGADDGFDFTITPAKAWTTWHPRRANATGQTLDADTHLTEFTFSNDSEDLITQARVALDSVACDLPVVLTAASGASTYGLIQTAIDKGETTDQDFLQALVDEELRINGQPRFRASVRLDSGLDTTFGAASFAVGDTLTLVAQRGTYVNVNRTVRVVSVDITVDRTGREQVSLELDGVA